MDRPPSSTRHDKAEISDNGTGREPWGYPGGLKGNVVGAQDSQVPDGARDATPRTVRYPGSYQQGQSQYSQQQWYHQEHPRQTTSQNDINSLVDATRGLRFDAPYSSGGGRREGVGGNRPQYQDRGALSITNTGQLGYRPAPGQTESDNFQPYGAHAAEGYSHIPRQEDSNIPRGYPQSTTGRSDSYSSQSSQHGSQWGSPSSRYSSPMSQDGSQYGSIPTAQYTPPQYSLPHNSPYQSNPYSEPARPPMAGSTGAYQQRMTEDSAVSGHRSGRVVHASLPAAQQSKAVAGHEYPRPPLDGAQYALESQHRPRQRGPADRDAQQQLIAHPSNLEQNQLHSREKPRHSASGTERTIRFKETESVLDPAFQIPQHPKKFFKPGAVFSVVWHEPEGRRPPDWTDHGSTIRGRFGEPLHGKVRRFIVMRSNDDSCICVGVFTYRDRGEEKDGVSRKTHAYIRTANQPQPRTLSKLGLDEYQMVPHGKETLKGTSLVNCEKIYTVEYYVKAKAIGMMSREDFSSLCNKYHSCSAARRVGKKA
ncbi:hypothetical protein FQN50_006617 [Emmonsiellopsis sp. PD_5]|nr:hypothetical protein FQN50_006617 [Emmonsiellopsis sp. PD_5]